MQEKIEARYPDVDDAAKISDTDINSPEWQKEIKACLASSWTKSQREEFLSECINTAKESKGQEKAKSYCECMLFKIEKKYPNADDASNITEADLKSESWQKIIKGCLDF
jgi:ATP-dependent Lon protease